MPKEGKNIQSHKYGTKALKQNHIILMDTESILQKYDYYGNNEDLSSMIKKYIHATCGFELTHLTNHTKSSITYGYHGEDSLDSLCA